VWSEGRPQEARTLPHIEAGSTGQLFVSKEENAIGNGTPEMGMTGLSRPDGNWPKSLPIKGIGELEQGML